MIPCVLFEDEHLLVVDKPAGVNTHAHSPFVGEGIYDWLRHREPRWASLAIIHRLDKETSGVMLFGKTPLANRALTEQFAARSVHKKYLLLTDRHVNRSRSTTKSEIRRLGEKYASGVGGEWAETQFCVAASRRNAASYTGEFLQRSAGMPLRPLTLVEAEPRTGRTHQIRVHAAESGFPILGDVLYGGSAAPRVFLHAAELRFNHPATGAACEFKSPVAWGRDRRAALIDTSETNAYRVIHGAGDGQPGWYVDRLGDFLLSQAERPLTEVQRNLLRQVLKQSGAHGAYHKLLTRQVRRTATAVASPQLIFGEPAPGRFEVLENSVRFELSFNEGYSTGLFLDQRDNRRRFLTNHVAAGFEMEKAETGKQKSEILNCFAYTCGFSVCAAKAGARTTSLDLSKKYLEWGRRNLAVNGIDRAGHDFIYGDAFDWLKRLARKGRSFDVLALDPPTFSQSKERGVFRADKDYGRLVTAALPVLRPGGVLLASCNTAVWPPEHFVETVGEAVWSARRRIAREHFVPQPLDFPIARAEPGYLKTLWLRVE